MTHQYRQHVGVMVGDRGEPASFTWRGVTYHICDVFATWHLRDRWWEAPPATADEVGSPYAASDRHYYRVGCREGLLCELYLDAAAGVWVLDRVLD